MVTRSARILHGSRIAGRSPAELFTVAHIRGSEPTAVQEDLQNI